MVPSPHEDLVSYDLEGICDYLSSHIKRDKKHANSFTEGNDHGLLLRSSPSNCLA